MSDIKSYLYFVFVGDIVGFYDGVCVGSDGLFVKYANLNVVYFVFDVENDRMMSIFMLSLCCNDHLLFSCN